MTGRFSIEVIEPVTVTGITDGGIIGGADPVFGFQGAVVNTTSGISIPNGVQHNIGWDTVAYDTSGFYDAGEVNRLTVPVGSGIEAVVLKAQIQWNANISPGMRFMDLKKNGSSVTPDVTSKVPNSAELQSTVPLLVSYPILVSDGDYFELTITQTSDGEATITTEGRTWFSIEVIK
jgi:hypothetical protein